MVVPAEWATHRRINRGSYLARNLSRKTNKEKTYILAGHFWLFGPF